MKIQLLFLVFFLILSCDEYDHQMPISNCQSAHVIDSYSKEDAVVNQLEALVREGAPGVSIAIQSVEGLWAHAAGVSKIEEQSPMRICHLQYLQSIAKTYMAAAIFLLKEDGLLDLDSNIESYLTSDHHAQIPRSDEITIRMLLNHTSGISEYNSDPAYVSYLLQNPTHFFDPQEYLGYINKSLDYEPGSRYRYTNTNYVILALIADSIIGDHAEYISDRIFEPLNLQNTYYRNDENYLNYPTLVNAYWDRLSNGTIENVSNFQRINVASLIGDDGIVADPIDAVTFLQALVEGQIISPTSFEEMKTWERNSKGDFAYGLGLDYATFEGNEAWGHSGGGLGAGCQLYFFPEKGITIYIGINLGTVTESPIHDRLRPELDKLYDIILND